VALWLTGDPPADELLESNPLALLVAMLLDQQVPMEKAFHSPYDLVQRTGTELDAGDIATRDPDELKLLFAERPALHRFPGSMAARTQDLCRAVVERYGGDAAAIWRDVASGEELFDRLRDLPGFGEQKARIFVALLAKRLGVQPPGWEQAAGPYGPPGHFSVADIDGPESLVAVRAYKKEKKAAAQLAAKPKR
jgi:uncharacterized HhH-GPD family protein